MRSTTILAFDYGLSQIGVAIGNTVTRTARPLCLVKATQGKPDWPSIEHLIDEWQPLSLVVGAPVNREGADSTMLKHCERFARQLEGRFDLTVTMVDESYSSKEAKSLSNSEGHSGDYKEAPVDHYAAAIFLGDFLADT